MRIGDLLLRSSRRYPHKTAIVFGEKRISFSELNRHVNALAHGFLKLGVKKGDKVATLMHNSLEIPQTCFFLAKIGCIHVPLNYRLTSDDILYCLNDSQVSVLIYSDDFEETVAAIKPQLETVTTFVKVGKKAQKGELNWEQLFSTITYEPEVDVKPTDDMFILYTSGTTGFPKGVILSHINYLTTLIGFAWNLHVSEKDIVLNYLPMYHVGAFLHIIMPVLFGGTQIQMRSFDPEQMLKIIDREKVSWVFVIPPHLINQILAVENFGNYNVSSLRNFGFSGGLWSIENRKKTLAKFPNAQLADHYGLTEAMNVCSLNYQYILQKDPSCKGKPNYFTDARIVDENDNDVPPGEAGELIIRGMEVMKGYYNKPVETSKVLRGGWLHTGDVFKMDEEGYFYLLDRVDDMVKTGGENVYPQEVEKVILTHQGVAEVAVVGVPDEKFGQAVKAFVVRKIPATVTEEELIEFCKKNLAGYKKPRHVEFVDELPKNLIGKVLKKVLRQKGI